MVATETVWHENLRRFVETSSKTQGFLALDLDGTALLEDKGKVFISSSVERGVKAVHDLKMPVILNTLRFPLSVMNTIGEAWYQIADVPILTILLNGSVLGYIKRTNNGLHYEELAAYPLKQEEITGLLEGIHQLCRAGVDDILLFFYSRNWQEGESLWTANPEKVPGLKKKYVSASRVFSSPVEQLAEELAQRQVCMTSLFIDRPEDTLMAYQHSKRSSFLTAQGVNKASGLREVAAHLHLSPIDALGAGDTEMDTFLAELGLAVIVGEAKLPFRGRKETVRVATPLELGELILAYADLAK
jgi:hydroxymethylpyrimidine pyrophosphatase-like HAD family hydrolase